MKMLLALVVAPVAPLVFIALVLALAGAPDAIPAHALICISFGYPAAILFGPLLSHLFQKKNWMAWWSSTFAGAAVGFFIPALYVFVLAVSSNDISRTFTSIAGLTMLGALGLYGAFLGSLSALTFWFMAMRPRRERVAA